MFTAAWSYIKGVWNWLFGPPPTPSITTSQETDATTLAAYSQSNEPPVTPQTPPPTSRIPLDAVLTSKHTAEISYGDGCYQRLIANNIGYKDTTGIWKPVDCTPVAIENADSFQVCTSNSLQVEIGSKDTGLITYTIVHPEHPEFWVTYTASGTNRVEPVKLNGDLIIYMGAWDFVDLTLTIAPGKIRESIVVNDLKAQTEFRFLVTVAPALQMIVKDSVALFLDRVGTRVFETHPPCGQQASALIETPVCRADMFLDHGDLVIKLNADDLSKALLPVEYS